MQWDYNSGLTEQQLRLLGKYILVTSLDRKTHDAAAQVIELYKSRYKIENRIRTVHPQEQARVSAVRRMD